MSFNPVVPILGSYHRSIIAHLHTVMWILGDAHFSFVIRVKNWKPPAFSKDFVISVPYVHATEYPSEIKSMRMNYVY